MNGHSIFRYSNYVLALALILAPGYGAFSQTTQTFTTSGSFTVPACVTTITVECWGGGGGGGGASEADGGASGSGGGGGGYAKAVLSNVSGTFTVTVGAAGTQGIGSSSSATNGGSGGNSIFTNGTISVTGGGGTGGTGSTGGVGTTVGQGGSGTFVGCTGTSYKGGNGALGNNEDDNTGGAGGGGAGSSSNGVTPPQTGEDANGTGGAGGTGNPNGAGGSVSAAYYENGGNGSSIGGGGAGGGGEDQLFHGTDPGNGGAGAAGEVIVTYSDATPTITEVTGSGCPGSTVTIAGTLLSGATSVKIGSTSLTSLSVTSTIIRGTIANGTTTGTVTVVTPCGTATSAVPFTVHTVSNVNLGPHTSCSGSYTFGGRTYTASGTYADTTSSTVTGCDSITTITLTIGSPVSHSISQSICPGNSYNFGGHTYTTAGTYSDTATSSVTGCDSITTLTLAVQQPINQAIADTVCAGGSYNFGGHTYNTSGVYADTATSSVTGCDSITTLSLTIGAALNQFISQTVCSDEGYNFGGQTYYTSGLYADTTTSVISGCDSITTLRLSIKPTPTSTTIGYICNRVAYMFNGQSYSNPGTYADTLTGAGANGCDSIAVLNLSNATTFGETVNISATPPYICNGDTAQICASPGFAAYSWNTGDTSTCLYTTTANNYSITATDTFGCTVQNVFNISAYTSVPPTILQEGDTLVCSPEASYQWYLNSHILAGDTNNYIIAVQPGPYAVNIVDTDGCTDTSAAYNYTTGITNLKTGVSITVYPNPLTSGNWVVNVSDNLTGSTCQLFDATGRSVFKSTITATHFEITADINKGAYILQINSAGIVYNLKLIKVN